MALARFPKSVDGTIPVPALLYEDETLIASQDGVGIYDGTTKSPLHQLGTVSLTSHRIFFVSASNPADSFSLDLAHVTQTEYYAGLFTSSPKITLHLALSSESDGRMEAGATSSDGSAENDDWPTWECEVCGYRNPPGLSPAKAAVCGLCGVPRSLSQSSSSSTPKSVSASTPAPSLRTSLTSMSTPSLPVRITAPATNNIPESGAGAEFIACPACTFHNHPSLQSCEICATHLPRPPYPSQLQTASTKSLPASPTSGADAGPWMIKLSFRKGGDKAFYAALKRSLLGKGWESNVPLNPPRSSTAPPGSTSNMSGINQILQSVQTTAQTRTTSLSSALTDLEALMGQAKHMVALASELTEQWRAVEAKGHVGGGDEEAAAFIRTSLAQLGLQMPHAPVTQDMVKDERRWTDELAKELAALVQGGDNGDGSLMRGRGVVGLDEVWGGWNRARGVALIPPSTFLQVLPHLPVYTSPPLLTRTFPSGLAVLHTPRFTHVAFTSRLSSLISLSGPRTTLDVALEEGMTVALAAEMIEEVERDGELCRDEAQDEGAFGGGREVRWWINIFGDYIWDGQ